jgi:hypothetical protein
MSSLKRDIDQLSFLPPDIASSKRFKSDSDHNQPQIQKYFVTQQQQQQHYNQQPTSGTFSNHQSISSDMEMDHSYHSLPPHAVVFENILDLLDAAK